MPGEALPKIGDNKKGKKKNSGVDDMEPYSERAEPMCVLYGETRVSCGRV